MTTQGISLRPVGIVLGCGDIGSAVALVLHQAGLAVALVDEADPAWHRRGMAFTNAWYLGNAELEGEGACFCASLKSVPSILARRLIAATTWSWPSVAAALNPTLLIDARGRKRRGADSLRGRVPITVGIGPAFADGECVDVAIPATAAGFPAAEEGASHPLSRDHDAGSDDAVRCTVEAQRYGRFMTERRIGDSVRIGQTVGGVGNEAVLAPADGVLLGLAARGARIEPGDTLVEVDPDRAPHQCYGIADGPRRIAIAVLAAFVGGPPRETSRVSVIVL